VNPPAVVRTRDYAVALAGAVSQVSRAATNWEAAMRTGDLLEAHPMLTSVRTYPVRIASAMIGCDCLDWRVHGHVCVALGPPSQGESNEWRDIPGLRDPAPRPEPAPGDWLSALPRERSAAA